MLASGGGTNLAAIIEAGLPVAVVIVDRPCHAIEVAADAGVAAELVERESYRPEFDRDAYTHRVVDALKRHEIDVVAMAGFGTILARPIHDAYPGRVLNTHPALLPAFKGWHAVADALAAGVTQYRLHRPPGHPRGGRRSDTGPGGSGGGTRGHRRFAPRAHQIRRAAPLPLDHPQLPGSPRERTNAMKVLLSVYDKTGLIGLAEALVGLGHELITSGGTGRALADAGIEHRDVETVTAAPEMLGGRVKTLHPKIHGGILADRSKPEHLADLAAQDIEPIDLVVCNLYPFGSSPSVELIDVGGPTMVRAAAKNFAHVGVVVDPADYGPVLQELRTEGALSAATRRRLARAAFAHTAAYDAAIATWFDALDGAEGGNDPLPPTVHLALEKAQSLRYGENPHQQGARYRETGRHSWWDDVVQHGGMALSYLNLYDADAAWRLVHQLADLGPAAAVVVKHANPCGAAVADDTVSAYDRAFECDPMSAFGGIVALSGPVSEVVAQHLVDNAKADVLVAPEFDPAALALFAAKRKNMRVLSAPRPSDEGLHLRQISGGWLVQEPYRFGTGRADWRVATAVAPTEEQWRDLELAWRVCAAVKSNAIVLAAGGMAVGIGGGQQNRVTPGEIAAQRAAGRAKGGAAASDAFFPFRDGLDTVAAAGVAAVIQPGGSLRDDEVVAAADEHGIAMVLTGERQFQH